MAATLSFEEKLAIGHEGELVAVRLLKQRGWFILPTYDFSGSDGESKAPKLQGADGRALVIPDVFGARNGECRWFECKRKTGATWTRITQRYEHGVAKRHYEDYLEVQRVTGIPVYLVIVEEDTQEILAARLDRLSVRFYEGRKMDRGGMAYFARSEFQVVCKISDVMKEDV